MRDREINIAGEKVRAVRVGAGHNQRGYAEHVSSETGCHQLLYSLGRGYQNLSPRWPHFFAEES